MTDEEKKIVEAGTSLCPDPQFDAAAQELFPSFRELCAMRDCIESNISRVIDWSAVWRRFDAMEAKGDGK